MIDDEGPTPEDLDRFASETAYCPDCAEEIWDQLDFCSACGAALPDGPVRTRPDDPMQKKWIAVIVTLVILGLIGFWAFVL